MATYTLNANNNTYVLGSEFTLILPKDQTVSASTTLVDVPELTVVVGKNDRYLLEYDLHFDTTTAGDLKYRTLSPAGGTPTRYRAFIEEQLDAATAATAVVTSEAERTVATASALNGVVRMQLLFENGGAAVDQGELKFQFAQANGPSGDTVLLAGSRVKVRRF